MSDDNYGDEGRGGDYEDEMEDNEEAFNEELSNSLDEENEEEEGEGDSDEEGSDVDVQEEADRIRDPDIIAEPVFETANKERITPPFLTKYEKARVIGVRATQISKNSPLYLNADDKDLSHWDPLYIAEKELSEKQIPFIIRRYLPDSSFEDWKLSELRMLQ